jgi:Flp pilus assembly pilin Flp
MRELLRRNRELLTQSLGQLWQDEDGQDLIEYTLLMAFVALSSAALFTSTGSSVSKIWSSSNVALSKAAVTAAS